MENITPLPSGYTLRRPTSDDLEAVTDLINACSIDEYGLPDITAGDLRSDWQQPGFDLATDAWAVLAPQGQIIAYADLIKEHGHFFAFVRTHPAHIGQGMATALLGLAEARAGERENELPPEGPHIIRAFTTGVNQSGQRLLEQRGYRAIRYFWQMKITLTDAPPIPAWPAGTVVRTLAPGEDMQPIHQVVDEAFRDHWEPEPIDFTEWEQRWRERAGFDPSLWFIALDGTEIAGVALCRYRVRVAWVGQLAVRRPWRKQGLGLALLQHAFSEFYRRGEREIGLGVDAQNLTGATRLYEKAGMRVFKQYDTYEKPLRSTMKEQA
ncbi:MAG TPA: GNAT family N-acetyltransferase [Ktedonobacterales bacterium]|jgi:mycothiol synthase